MDKETNVAGEQVAHNRMLQQDLYGEPLADLLGRVCDVLGLTQARLADIVGLSAPMLSQLIGGHRAKIGNPAVVQRVQGLIALADEVSAQGSDPGAIEARIAEIKGSSGAFTRTDTGAGPAGVRILQGVLRAVASADELAKAARKLERDSPALAEVLRVYGTGRTSDAQAHFERIQHLI